MHTVDHLHQGESTVHLRQDRVIVIDVEATCWRGRAPRGQQSEIIEIGVCVFDRQARAPADLRSILATNGPLHNVLLEAIRAHS